MTKCEIMEVYDLAELAAWGVGSGHLTWSRCGNEIRNIVDELIEAAVKESDGHDGMPSMPNENEEWMHKDPKVALEEEGHTW